MKRPTAPPVEQQSHVGAAMQLFEYYLHAFAFLWETVLVACLIYEDPRFGRMLSEWYYVMNAVYFALLLNENNGKQSRFFADLITPAVLASNAVWSLMSIVVLILGEADLSYNYWPIGGPDISDALSLATIIVNHLFPFVLSLIHLIVHRKRVATVLAISIHKLMRISVILFILCAMAYLWAPLLPFAIYAVVGHAYDAYGIPLSKSLYMSIAQTCGICVYVTFHVGTLLLLRHQYESIIEDYREEEEQKEENQLHRVVPHKSSSTLNDLDSPVYISWSSIAANRQ